MLRTDNGGVLKEINTPEEISETFNNFFVKVGENFANKIGNTSGDFHTFLGQKVTNTFYILPVTSTEIKNIICLLKGTKPVAMVIF